ncbi:MAG: winged helix-turn-helix domain-containing protein [Anaerolineales bacterium]
MPHLKPVTPTLARRLALAKQRLIGPRPSADANGLMEVARDLGCIQLDPISAVARTHWIVLWSRLGHYDRAHFDQLMWQERKLFEYWAHSASIVLTEDYPLFSPLMRGYPWSDRTRNWVKQNEELKRYIISRIRRHGPVLSRALEEDGLHPEAWVSTGWTAGRNVSRMLDFLWIGGKIMVAGRQGGQKAWDLTQRVLPDWAPRDRLPEREVVRRAAQKSLRALGVATPRQIRQHFIRGRYPDLKNVLDDLEKEGRILRVQVEENGEAWPDIWYIHRDDEALLDQLSQPEYAPRTTLLSPFDNLICDRARTEQLFNFKFTIEIYVPKAKRQYGYYVLPILHGDRLIGRIDPVMDRAQGRLIVNAVYAEPGAPTTRATARAVAGAVEELATFLSATAIVYDSKRVPAAWKRALLA